MKYSELKNTQQAAFNNFEGIVFAFSNKQLEEALKDESFLQDALTYELCNHEYCITGNTRDALAALDLTSEEIPGHVMKASRIAASKDY